MTMHLRFVNLWRAVAHDQDITNFVSKAKITVEIGFVNACTAYALWI